MKGQDNARLLIGPLMVSVKWKHTKQQADHRMAPTPTPSVTVTHDEGDAARRRLLWLPGSDLAVGKVRVGDPS